MREFGCAECSEEPCWCLVRPMRMTGRAVALVTSLLGVLLVSCGTDDPFDVIRSRQANASSLVGQTLPEMLQDPSPDGLTVVEGTIVEVANGVGMTWTFDDDGEERRQLLAFDDDSAMTRSVHVTMTVDRVLAGHLPPGDARFGLVISDEGQAAALRGGLVGNQYVAVLTRSPVFDYEPALYGVLVDGGLLCRWNEDRTLDCPALDDSLKSALDIAAVSDSALTAHR